jgi:hypothetical protein
MRFSRYQNTKKIQTQRNREKKKQTLQRELERSSLEICKFIQENVHPDHYIALRAREHSEAGGFCRLVAAWFAGFAAVRRGVCRASVADFVGGCEARAESRQRGGVAGAGHAATGAEGIAGLRSGVGIRI